MILIFSIRFDYSTTYVIKLLNYWGIKTIRINGDDNNYKFFQLTREGIYFENTITHEIVNLKEAKACWWRRTGIRFRHFKLLPDRKDFIINGLDLTSFIKGENNYLDEEAKTLREYIFKSIYEKALINLCKPLFNLNRLIVFDIAMKYGLRVPSYKVISKGVQLINAQKELGIMITKAACNGIYTEIQNQSQNHRFYTYTELVENKFIEENKDNTFFPSMVSELIQKKLEIRTFYIDGQFYSMAIFSQIDEQTKIDFRKYSNNRNEPYKLPKDIEIKLDSVFKELDLNCGSADLILDKDDNFIFLEINPVGQFGMTSEPCNYELHKKVAKYLSYGQVN